MGRIRKWAWLAITIMLLFGSYIHYTNGNSKLVLSYIIFGVCALVFTIILFNKDRRNK